MTVRTLKTTPGRRHALVHTVDGEDRRGVSHAMVGRIWRTFRLQPHRTETFKSSLDPQLAEKTRKVVGVHVAPPVNAVAFSVDEKSQIRAL